MEYVNGGEVSQEVNLAFARTIFLKVLQAVWVMVVLTLTGLPSSSC